MKTHGLSVALIRGMKNRGVDKDLPPSFLRQDVLADSLTGNIGSSGSLKQLVKDQ